MLRICAFYFAVAVATVAAGTAQSKPPIEKLTATTYRLGQLRIDTAKRELRAPGVVNDVTTIEFVANTKSGYKAYESALTIDSDAISFNAALLLLGLDPKRARLPKQHFDPLPPEGDPVDIFVETAPPDPPGLLDAPPYRRVRVEELLFDKRTNKPLAEGPWVYTGSMFTGAGRDRRYVAEMDGVLIGFVHSPAAIIENPRAGAVNAYGAVVLNPHGGFAPKSPVILTVKVLPRASN